MLRRRKPAPKAMLSAGPSTGVIVNGIERSLPPNGSRLSCGRNARRRKSSGRTSVPRQGHNTPVPLKRSPPASFKRLLGGTVFTNGSVTAEDQDVAVRVTYFELPIAVRLLLKSHVDKRRVADRLV
jgi:hypothetical protein